VDARAKPAHDADYAHIAVRHFVEPPAVCAKAKKPGLPRLGCSRKSTGQKGNSHETETAKKQK
jgi:hypothetical protein